MYENKMILKFDAKSENEALARLVVAAFTAKLDPTLEEMADIKTAVSEAVTNAVIHGYPDEAGEVTLKCEITDKTLEIEIKDNGVGIEDIEKAREPLFTTRPELERSGMGFVFMEVFMDTFNIISAPGKGTLIRMKKTIGKYEID